MIAPSVANGFYFLSTRSTGRYDSKPPPIESTLFRSKSPSHPHNLPPVPPDTRLTCEDSRGFLLERVLVSRRGLLPTSLLLHWEAGDPIVLRRRRPCMQCLPGWYEPSLAIIAKDCQNIHPLIPPSPSFSGILYTSNLVTDLIDLCDSHLR